MAASARKSSIGGARRGIQKAHIPYRGDNPAVGKKTGIAVRNIERKSDGFEPFDELIQQVDKRTPPRPAKARRRKKSIAVEEEQFDENGEMSMELDNSPMPYLTSAKQMSTPTSLRRVASTSRIVARTPDVDFDSVPSPRPRSQTRKSVGRPSKLSITSTSRYSSPEADAIDAVLRNGADRSNLNYTRFSAQYSSPYNASFLQMDQDDDDEGNEPFQEPDIAYTLPEPEEASSPKTKGKRRKEQTEEEREHDTEPALPDSRYDSPEEVSPPKSKGKRRQGQEEERDQGNNELASPDNRYDSPEEVPEEEERRTESEPEPEPEPKTVSKKKGLQDDSGRPLKRSKKENRPQREGVRRSAREHIKPLEWWRGERYVYGRGTSAGSPVYVAPIKEIMRIPKEPVLPFGAKRKRSSARGRSKSRVVEQPPIMYNPEEGWDEATSDKGVVLDYPGGKEKMRQIAFTGQMYQPQLAANNEWSYQRVFGDSEFIAAGQLTIPVAGQKPSKSAKDNTYIFYIAEGAVNFKVHDTSFVLATGGMIMVPRGNTYYIENIADREAKLVFTQARKLAPSEEEVEHQRVVNNRRSIESGMQ